MYRMDIASVSSIAGQKKSRDISLAFKVFSPYFKMFIYFIPRFLTEPCLGKRGRDQRTANTAHTTVSTYTRINNAWNETISWYLSSSYCSPLSLLGFVILTDWSACWILQNCDGFLSIVAYPIFRAHFKFTGPTKTSVTDKSKHLIPAANHQ